MNLTYLKQKGAIFFDAGTKFCKSRLNELQATTG
jgi:hypothetical protein